MSFDINEAYLEQGRTIARYMDENAALREQLAAKDEVLLAILDVCEPTEYACLKAQTDIAQAALGESE